ncbi:trypsin-like serine protease [Robertmurraya yapensis]|uniref:Serine protease n=2 Tax=Bacillaceae TaxID=186817 RepID=A0A431VXU8_9BACI|nr:MULTISPECIES: trypsin-like serine protease [Bacillaceae]RTR28127.1 trypsin-like serine protease [Bacillus yapensis]TKC15151.1 trypsin-like serine protease [Robertmurraya kyonggiensis]TKS94370.1 trypsin-like serine protease [Bacillus yapensis]
MFIPTSNVFAAENTHVEAHSVEKDFKYIKYDLGSQTKSLIKNENPTKLGDKPFISQGKIGYGELEKVNLEDFKSPNKTWVDPLTGEELNNQIKPFEVIGSDGRQKVISTASMPYRALTYIQFENLFNAWSCSGGVIAQDLVVTNAHCVTEADILVGTVFPGLNDSTYSYGYYTITEIIYPEQWTSTNGSSDYDYAILRVSTDSSGNHIGNRAGILSWQEAGTINANSILSTYGYPGDKMEETGLVSMWGMEGRSDSYIHSNLLFHNMDTFGGQSGSPILNMYHRMIAVHNGSYTLTANNTSRLVNGGPKIRRDFTNLYNLMLNN